MSELTVTEIFYSIQGESRTSGYPTVFIRLTGCPIRCSYCDTSYAFAGGEKYTIDQVIDNIANFGATYVTVTGGEPLAQVNSLMLMQKLCDQGYNVSVETGGMFPIDNVDERVSIVLDIKTPGSNEMHSNLVENYAKLRKHDQIKFVVCDEDDFDWSCSIIEKHKLLDVCEIYFSPSYQEIEEKELAQLLLKSKLPARMQLQMHKKIWGDIPGV